MSAYRICRWHCSRYAPQQALLVRGSWFVVRGENENLMLIAFELPHFSDIVPHTFYFVVGTSRSLLPITGNFVDCLRLASYHFLAPNFFIVKSCNSFCTPCHTVFSLPFFSQKLACFILYKRLHTVLDYFLLQWRPLQRWQQACSIRKSTLATAKFP